MGRMTGKLALVTGASRGIGRGIAERFAAEGASVAINASRDEAGAAELARLIGAGGGRAVVVMGDVSSEDDVRRVVAETVSAFGGLDVVVSNAGIDISDPHRTTHEFEVADWDRVIAVNLRGAFLVMKFAIPHLLERGGGSILAIGSVAGLLAWKADAPYNASKAGLHVLVQTIAAEYGARGISANCICPGVIETDMHSQYLADSSDAEALDREILARHPIGRYGRVDEVAAVAVTLCSGEASFVTGALIPVDGGYTAV